MNYLKGFSGRYISAADLDDRAVTATIARATIEEIEDGRGSAKRRLVVYFEQSSRGWVVNRTNAEALVAMWGPDTDAWIGHRVTLHSQIVRMGAKRVPGIRVLGSPDLDEAITFDLCLPRKRPTPYRLEKTQ